MSDTKRGWWIDDDGFLRHPDNVRAYNLGNTADLLDEKDTEMQALQNELDAVRADNARLFIALNKIEIAARTTLNGGNNAF